MQPTPYREIPLYRKDGSVRAYALIDAADYEKLGSYRWCLDSKGYAYRHWYRNGQHTNVRLHRELLGLTPAERETVVDHINGDPLDNRRSNLRIGTRALNQQNRRKQKGTSRYRGVTLYRNGKWMAQCQIAGKIHHLGYFTDEDEAGRVVAAFRAEHMPFATN